MQPCLDAADGLLAALADPTRRSILDALARRGEATATVLTSDVAVTRQAVVKHLSVLDAAGLVRGQRRGREVRYAVVPRRLVMTARCLAAVAEEWEGRLAAIKRIAETKAGGG